MLLKELGQSWLERMKTRKRKPVKQATIDIFSSYLRNHINPLIGDLEVENFQSRQLKEFAEALLAKDLAPKTTHELVNVVQQIVKSAQDENGNPLYVRNWNRDFILENVPDVRDQHRPTVTKQQLQEAVKERHAHTDKYRVLIALLAASGIRIGELVALRVGDDGQHSGWDQENSLLAIRTSLYRGKEQKPKTENSIRLVDLSTPVNEMLAAYAKATNKKPGDYLFATKKGTAFTPHGLHKQVLIPLGIPGFHSLRRWRVSHLKMIGTPEPLLKMWIGHANGNDITSRYDKSTDDKEWCRLWADKCGIGFELPEIDAVNPPPQPTKPVKPSRAIRLVAAVADDEPASTHYQATEDDLDPFFYSTPEPVAEEA